MFTIECSKVMAKNSMIGIHIAITLPVHRGGDHRADHAGRDHPVAEHAADEQRQHAGGAVRGVADGAALADACRAPAPTLSGGVEKPKVVTIAIISGDREGAGEIADEHEAPVAQHAVERHARPLVDQGERTQHEHAGQQVEAEQIQHAEADREQDRADDRIAGLAR